MKVTKKDIKILATEFSAELLRTIGKKELARVVRLNRIQTDKGICHSHDFCDSNEVMMEAFEECFKQPIDLAENDHMNLMDLAWNEAKENNFNILVGD